MIGGIEASGAKITGCRGDIDTTINKSGSGRYAIKIRSPDKARDFEGNKINPNNRFSNSTREFGVNNAPKIAHIKITNYIKFGVPNIICIGKVAGGRKVV